MGFPGLMRVRGMYAEFLSLGDERVKKWPLMDTPMPCLYTVLIYFLMVRYGQRFMRDRKAFDLKSIIVPYNIINVIVASYIVYEVMYSVFSSNYSLVCNPIDHSTDPLAMKMANATWVFFVSKIFEMLDTVFLILRKKQPSFLHTYHHSAMILFCWTHTYLYPGGDAYMCIALNSLVHVVMYTYYGLAAMGPSVRKYLWWKEYVTVLQLIQFLIYCIYTSYIVVNGCPYPKYLALFGACFSGSFVILFSMFYYGAYIRKRKTKEATKEKKGR